MFLGQYYYAIDDKFRLILPKSFRDQETTWILTRGFDGGLFLFPQEEFAKELAKLEGQSLTKKNSRDLVRLLTNTAHEIAVDGVGRFHIPEALRAPAQLVKQVVIVGSYNRVEIWDVATYHAYMDQVNANAEDIAEHV